MHKEVCRLCLIQTPIYSSLLEETTAKMLDAVASIKVSSDGLISNAVCTKCRLNLKLAYSIQQKMIRSNEKLMGRHIKTEKGELNISVKQEPERDDSPDEIELGNQRCMICGRMPRSLTTHMQNHFKQIQNCDLCSQSFANIQTYRQHLVNHPYVHLYSCDKCGATFRYKTFYDQHTMSLHKKDLPVNSVPKLTQYTCDLCSKSFPTKSKCAQHQKMNHKKQSCPICQKELVKSSMRHHLASHTDSLQICQFCGATLKNRTCLRMHLLYSHNKSTFPCDTCGKVYKKAASRNRHIQSAHGEPSHICDTCGKRFFASEKLNKHIKMTHLKLRPHICEFCKKGFSSKNALTTHRRKHTNETPYRCEICGDGFKQNVLLRGHRKSKHNIEEPKTCKCQICGKGFASDWALQTHVRLH